MKGNFILGTSFFVFAILSCILAVYSMTLLYSIRDLSTELSHAGEISLLALDFNVENFHTQLEVWEYAFEPKNIRWIAFESHNKQLTKLAEELTLLIEGESLKGEHEEITGLVPGGEERITEIIADLELVRTDWENLFSQIKEAERLAELGGDSLTSPYHEEYIVAMDGLRAKMEANELLFDELQFNNEVDKFVSEQEQLTKDINEKIESEGNKFLVVFAILITLLVILSLGVVLFLVFTHLRKRGKRK